MKHFHRICFLAACFAFFTSACSKDEAVPSLTISPPAYLSGWSFILNGTVTDIGDATVTDRGFCWGASHNPTTAGNRASAGSGGAGFSCTIVGLNPNTRVYVRAYAVSSAGTGYSEEITFRTWNTETAEDYEGNIYHTVTVGSRVWMVENLKTMHYRNGVPIPDVTGNGDWENLATGAYCNYNNDPGKVGTYGRLYNWFAVNDPQGLAPDGWHIPSDAEWTQLSSYLGGEGTAGGKLKEAGLTHWLSPNDGATNETGFTALPGGHRLSGGSFDYLDAGTGWWGSTEVNTSDAVIRYLDFGSRDLWNYVEDKRYGRSVRCVKD